MRRKIALGLTAVVTLLLLVLRSGLIPAWNDLTIGSLDIAHIIPFILVAVTVILAVLCYQKEESPCIPHAAWKSPCGWFSTFAGAVLTLTTLYNVICLAVFGEIPPPNTIILNQIDNIAMILMLIFGLAGGVFLVMLGFNWMAGIKKPQAFLPWLSITPTLWMWFRLARYEMSYASTMDISENVYNFSTMIFVSLFLIQLARATMNIGKAPRNSLLLFALCAAMVTVSGIPGEFLSIPVNASLSTLLVVVVDMVIGLFAAVYAVMLVFVKKTDVQPVIEKNDEPVETVAEDSLPVPTEESTTPFASDEPAEAWEAPDMLPAPVEPPFVIDNPLPKDIPVKKPVSSGTNDDIDDILAQIDNDF